MFQNRYNRIVLPLFCILDTFILITTYHIIGYVFNNLISNHLFSLVLALIWLAPSIYYKTFDIPRTRSSVVSIRPLLFAYPSFTLLYVFMVKVNLLTSGSFIFHCAFLFCTLTIFLIVNLSRFFYVYNYRLKGKNTQYAILVSQNADTENLDRIKQDAFNYGYKFVRIFKSSANIYTSLIQSIKSQKVDQIFIFKTGEVSTDKIATICDDYGIRLKILIPLSKISARRMGLDQLGGYPIMDIRHEPLLYLGNHVMKRTVDFFMASISIVFILTWLPVVVKLAQAFSYPGPLFFIQERIGRDGKIFNLYKFRTMVYSKEAESAKKGQAEKTHEMDKRVPWFGRLLRRTNLDEYPQFLNVLFGSMSTVGPRPHMVGEDKVLVKKVRRYRVRRFVKPGITGWAAIHGYRGGTDDIELMSKRTEHDIWYLENWTIWLDIKIMAITIWQMITLRIPRAY